MIDRDIEAASFRQTSATKIPLLFIRRNQQRMILESSLNIFPDLSTLFYLFFKNVNKNTSTNVSPK